MDDFETIYLDDDEERNAPWPDRFRPGVRPRTQPGRRTIVVPPSRRPTVIHGAGGGGAASAGYQRPQTVVVRGPAAKESRFAGLSTGELIELGAKLLAAIQPLPSAPTAQGQMGIDVENLAIYQTALANHAKRDEQLRTLGELLGKILK